MAAQTPENTPQPHQKGWADALTHCQLEFPDDREGHRGQSKIDGRIPACVEDAEDALHRQVPVVRRRAQGGLSQRRGYLELCEGKYIRQDRDDGREDHQDPEETLPPFRSGSQDAHDQAAYGDLAHPGGRDTKGLGDVVELQHITSFLGGEVVNVAGASVCTDQPDDDGQGGK